LQLAPTIGTVPPRASAGARSLRRWFEWHRWSVRLRDGSSLVLTKLRAEVGRDLVTGGLTPGLAILALLPGGVHWWAGYRLRGAMIAMLFWPLAAVGVALVGTVWGAALLGLALAVHVASIIDLLVTPEHTFAERTMFLPAVALAMLAAWYGPLVYWASTEIVVRRLVVPLGMFETGDVVLFRRGISVDDEPRPGTIVMYELGRVTGMGRIDYELSERFDRILAGPGSTISWREGRLCVDGQPSRWQPVADCNIPRDMVIKVPANYYGVLPGTLPRGREASQAVWEKASVVPREKISARAWLRNYPWSRATWLD
jgi:hypothetical protein